MLEAAETNEEKIIIVGKMELVFLKVLLMNITIKNVRYVVVINIYTYII